MDFARIAFGVRCVLSSLWELPAITASKLVITAGLIPAPNHGHRSRKAAAHVEREEFSHVLNLACAGLSGELLICFVNLANPSRAYRVTVANESAPRVHRNFEWRPGFLGTYLRQCRSATFHKVHAFPWLGEAENFISDDFGNGKTIVDLGALQIARGQVCHAKSFLSRFARDRKRWRIFLIERQIIGGMTVAKQSGGLAPITADLVQILSRNENNRCRAVGDLRTIRDF